MEAKKVYFYFTLLYSFTCLCLLLHFILHCFYLFIQIAEDEEREPLKSGRVYLLTITFISILILFKNSISFYSQLLLNECDGDSIIQLFIIYFIIQIF